MRNEMYRLIGWRAWLVCSTKSEIIFTAILYLFQSLFYKFVTLDWYLINDSSSEIIIIIILSVLNEPEIRDITNILEIDIFKKRVWLTPGAGESGQGADGAWNSLDAVAIGTTNGATVSRDDDG